MNLVIKNSTDTKCRENSFMIVRRLKRIEPPHMEYYPFVVDYDFKRFRPRGGSACIDFFSSGKLFSIVNTLDQANIVYIQKNGIAPESGFFLMDFAETVKNPKKFIDILKGMQVSDIYVEDSERFPLDKILAGNDFSVRLVSFG